jgi:glucokinase
VVAGSVALGFGAPFFAAAQAELDTRARLDFSAGARIVPGDLGDAGPLVGAGAVEWRAAGLDLGIG